MRDIVKTIDSGVKATDHKGGITKEWAEKDGLISTETVIDKGGWIDKKAGW
jgi:hypothetical protein